MSVGSDGNTGDGSVLEARVIRCLVAVGVDFDAGVRDAVVVVVRVHHVKNPIVVIVCVGTVGCSVVVVVRIEEVWRSVTVKVAVNDLGERWRPLCVADEIVKAAEEAGCGSVGCVDSISLPSDIINATGVLTVLVERPNNGGAVFEIVC